MLVTATHNTGFCCNTYTYTLLHSSLLSPNRNGNKPLRLNIVPPTSAHKQDSSKFSDKGNKALFPLRLANTTTLVIQSAIAVFALGFIDAGYSGDWSRIGVISRGTEDFLKVAAFVVVPFCFFVVISLSRKDGNEG